jgi:hypothetical protein
LHQSGACPSGAGLQLFHRSWSQAGHGGWNGGLIVPCMTWAQQGLKGNGFGGRGGHPSELWDQLQAGVQSRLVVGIQMVVDLVAWPRGGYSGMVWVWILEAGVTEGWVSHCVWVWHRAVDCHSPRGREPSRTEQQLCRPIGKGFGRPAVLLLDRGVMKPSTI